MSETGANSELRLEFLQIAVELRLDKDYTIKEFLDHHILCLAERLCDSRKLPICLLIYSRLGSGGSTSV